MVTVGEARPGAAGVDVGAAVGAAVGVAVGAGCGCAKSVLVASEAARARRAALVRRRRARVTAAG
jgi:hypothetical protein